MSLKTKVLGVQRRVEHLWAPRAWYRPTYLCPICGYEGPFEADVQVTGRRAHAICPGCGCSERHRTQALVMNELATRYDFSTLDMLHFAPEAFFTERFRSEFRSYTTADIEPEGVDLVVDLTDTDLPDASYDVIYASHVLEHIVDDTKAVATVHRLLRPGGFAILPVPIVCEQTVEFPEVVPTEWGHVRAPGPDYFDRFEGFEIERFTSADLDDRHQVWVYEDRSRWPNPEVPYRTPSPGTRHIDIVPVFHRR
jgi:SAM-dependent methyltransferase